MRPSEKYLNAIDTLWKSRFGSVRKIDGSIVKGSMFDETSPTDDDLGIGFIVLEDRNGNLHRIYSNEFAELIEAW